MDLSAGLPAALHTPCVSSFLVLSLWILGSGQVAVVKPGAVYVSAAPRPVWPQSSLAQLCLLAMQGGSTVLGHVLIAAVWAPSPGFPDRSDKEAPGQLRVTLGTTPVSSV